MVDGRQMVSLVSVHGRVDGSILVFFRCSVFRVYYDRAEDVRMCYGTRVCYATYKSGQAVLAILPRMVVPA